MPFKSAQLGLTLGLTVLATQLPLQGAIAQGLPPVPLDHTETDLLDIRGVGDAGMARTYKQPLKLTDRLPQGVTADFGKRLDALDPTGTSYKGDLSFINWETVVGTYCQRFRGRPSRSSYAFMSRPENLSEAYERGFNLVGLANNHSYDCPRGASGNGKGGSVTAWHMKQLSHNWLWHGVSAPGTSKTAPAIKTMRIKGRTIKVAFGSLYMGGYCENITCRRDQWKLLQAMRDANVDLRILSLHSWNAATQQQLVNTGRNFIKNYKGDVVFGHGPHVWKPVTVLPSNSGRKGVMFESLGNFIHPNLAAKRRDMIGRALFEIHNTNGKIGLKLRQVQAIPLTVNGALANLKPAVPLNAIKARGFSWKPIGNSSSWRSGVDSVVRGVYQNF